VECAREWEVSRAKGNPVGPSAGASWSVLNPF
jgi:hypothetical protein